jgi:hypothetical protein
MRPLVSLVAFLSLICLSPPSSSAQVDDTGYIYVFNYWKAVPGQGAAYNTFIREHSIPIYDELVKRGPLIDYRFLPSWTGGGDFTHVFISVYPDWDSMDEGVTPEENAAACQAAFNMTCAEHRELYPPGIEMRTWVRREILYSLRTPGN